MICQQLGKLILLVIVWVTRQDRARHYPGKRLENSGRKDRNEKGSNSRKRIEKWLVDRKRGLAGKVEGLHNGKEKETFQEGKQSVRNGGPSKTVRKLMGRGVNQEDEWEEEGGLVVEELGRRMVTEQWSIGEEALVNERRVPRKESTTLAWVSDNRIAPELTQIKPIPRTFIQRSATQRNTPKQHWCTPTTNVLPRKWSLFPCQMKVHQMPDSTGEEQLLPGPYQYHAPGTSG